MKNLAIPISLVATLIGVAVGYGALQNKVTTQKEDVVKLEGKVEKTKEAVSENEKIDLRQSIILETIANQLNKLDEKLDLEIKKDRW